MEKHSVTSTTTKEIKLSVDDIIYRFEHITACSDLRHIFSRGHDIDAIYNQISAVIDTSALTCLLAREVMIMADIDHSRIDDLIVGKCDAMLPVVYREMNAQFDQVRIDLSLSYAGLVKRMLDCCEGIMQSRDMEESQFSEGVMRKKIQEIETHFKRVAEQERQCRTDEVSILLI